MTKKILALALAGTTAFSVFASAMSVNAGLAAKDPAKYDDAYRPYTAETLAESDFDSATSAALLRGLALSFNVDGVGQDIRQVLESAAEEGVTKVYFAYDYADRDTVGDNVTAFKNKLQDVLDGGTTTNAQLKTAFTTAYTDYTPTDELTYGEGASSDRATAIYNLNSIYNGTVKKYLTITPGTPDTAVANVTKMRDVYDKDEIEGYNLDQLFVDIFNAYTDQDGTTTSEAIYLKQQYDYIIGNILAADATDPMDDFDELYAKLSERIADDYTSTNWRNFQRLMEDAREAADEAKTVADWNDAIDILHDAEAVEPKAGTYTELQNALADLFTDGKTSSIVREYVSGENSLTMASKAVYDMNDYLETNMYGSRGLTNAYVDAFVNSYESHVNQYDSAYTKAYDVWAKARRYGAKVAQSEIDNALAELESAIAALDSTSSAPNYQLVLLQTALDNVASYEETDYNATSRKYKDYVAALEKAEEIMAKANPAASEVIKAFTTLADAAGALNDVAKKVPSSLTKSLREAINDATVSLKEMSSKNGAQYVALQEALAIARDIQADNWGADDITYNGTKTFKIKSTISDYETAIANLETAMNGFNQVQGWYEEAGAWKYGEGDGVLNNGWNKIGNFWFFFNEDGTAKQNIWMNEGGKWYYFGNSCVAYSGWGMVDGSWYYFGKDCVMATGWIRPSHSYYYMDPASGKMVTGWAQIGGKWYYFSQASNNLGAMLTSTTTPDGYQVGADGAMI